MRFFPFLLEDEESLCDLCDLITKWYRKSSLQWTFVVEIYLQYCFLLNFCFVSAFMLATCGFHREIWTSRFGNRPDFPLPGLGKWKNEKKKKKRCFLGLALRLTRHFAPTYLCAWVCETKLLFFFFCQIAILYFWANKNLKKKTYFPRQFHILMFIVLLIYFCSFSNMWLHSWSWKTIKHGNTINSQLLNTIHTPSPNRWTKVWVHFG